MRRSFLHSASVTHPTGNISQPYTLKKVISHQLRHLLKDLATHKAHHHLGPVNANSFARLYSLANLKSIARLYRECCIGSYTKQITNELPTGNRYKNSPLEITVFKNYYRHGVHATYEISEFKIDRLVLYVEIPNSSHFVN